MAFKIIAGMKFRDVKQREFLVTDVFHLCDEGINGMMVTFTLEGGLNIHFNGPDELTSLKKIGFKEIGKENSDPIIRPIETIYDLEKKQLIKFTNPS